MAASSDILTLDLIAQLEGQVDLIFGKGGATGSWAEMPWVQTYVLAPDEDPEKMSLPCATMTGWHLFAEDDEGEVAAIRIGNDSELGPVFEGVERGPQTTAAAHLLEKPSDEVADISKATTPRLLSVPGLGLRALWYAIDGQDHVIPLAVSRPPFEPSVVISGAEFEAQLHPIARNSLKLYRERRSGRG
jgi:hypothetical protein